MIPSVAVAIHSRCHKLHNTEDDIYKFQLNYKLALIQTSVNNGYFVSSNRTSHFRITQVLVTNMPQ